MSRLRIVGLFGAAFCILVIVTPCVSYGLEYGDIIGEYRLIGYSMVSPGPEGEVHGFEVSKEVFMLGIYPDMMAFISKNKFMWSCEYADSHLVLTLKGMNRDGTARKEEHSFKVEYGGGILVLSSKEEGSGQEMRQYFKRQ